MLTLNLCNFKYLIMSETQFLPSNIILQNALEYNVKVVSRIGGPSKIGARLYDKKNEKCRTCGNEFPDREELRRHKKKCK